MSKARLVITAVILEGRTQAEVAATYGVSKGWVSKLIARYNAEGETAFEPRSRRPRTSPGALDARLVELIHQLRTKLDTAGLDAGPETITWHLHHHHGVLVSRSTISRHLTKAGLVTPDPKKRPKSSYIRFEAQMPNETWQSDFTHYRLTTGIDVEIISWLDDCTRYALSVTAHRRITGPIVTATFRQSLATHGIPASTLTDNGMVYTVRLAGGRGGRNTFENELRRLHVVQKNSRPNQPTTCGKVERFQQTMKKWLRAQPVRASHTRRAPRAPRDLRRRVQPRPTAPLTAAPSDPRSALRHHAQGHARRVTRPRHPRPHPPRPHRQSRLSHPAASWPTPPNRHL